MGTMVRVGTGRTGRAIVTTNVRALLLKEKEGRCASTAVVSGKTTASTTFVVRRTKPTDEKNETALAAARPPLFPQDYRLDVLCISHLYSTFRENSSPWYFVMPNIIILAPADKRRHLHRT